MLVEWLLILYYYLWLIFYKLFFVLLTSSTSHLNLVLSDKVRFTWLILALIVYIIIKVLISQIYFLIFPKP